jgi:hypothetical protein
LIAKEYLDLKKDITDNNLTVKEKLFDIYRCYFDIGAIERLKVDPTILTVLLSRKQELFNTLNNDVIIEALRPLNDTINQLFEDKVLQQFTTELAVLKTKLDKYYI